jgi:hypothetical protein
MPVNKEELEKILDDWCEGGVDNPIFVGMRHPDTPLGEKFLKYLKDLPSYTGTVYRGAIFDLSVVETFRVKEYEMTLNSAASKKKSVAVGFLDLDNEDIDENFYNVLIEAHTKSGKYITPFLSKKMKQEYQDDVEVILLAHTKWAVKKWIYGKKYTTIILEEI